MTDSEIGRRQFISAVLGGVCALPLDWQSIPKGLGAPAQSDRWDAVIIGSGLGGLACAAAFARQGFRALVLEQHDRPGGYATSFKRPGGFEFDVSLHSTSVGERNGVRNLIGGFPEITEVEFLPHANLYRAIFPEHDIRVPQRNLDAYSALLAGHFPAEKAGIDGIFADMGGIQGDIARLQAARGQIDMSRFPAEFPFLYKCASSTWGQMVDARLQDPRLKAIVSSLWGYYGLPPSKLAALYYAVPTLGYLKEGGYYPRGRSQTISNALVRFIEGRGGKVLLRSRVEKILVRDRTALGVVTADGRKYEGRVVVSNASVPATFRQMIGEQDYLKEYLAALDRYSVSLSCFQVFLGLKQDLVRKTGITDSEIFVSPFYDPEAEYRAELNADVENGSFSLTLYDNVDRNYSPAGKNTLNIMVLQGYGHWEKYRDAYFKGNKAAYRQEKERMAGILISKAEKTLLPGLSKAIDVKEIGTPLTHERYTGNYRGAIYGWDQTPDNSGNRRLPNRTPVNNLYLSGAWTSPGHGYGAVLSSGLQCFAQIMQSWR